jgi:hypothetical protein
MYKIRAGALGIAAIVALISLPTAGFAAGPTEAEGRAACSGDAMRFCSSMIPNKERVAGCLKGHRQQLSATCKALFDKYDPIPGPTANSASRSLTTGAPSAGEKAPTVAQPAAPTGTAPPAAQPAAPAETAQPISETSAAIAPSTTEMPMPAGMPGIPAPMIMAMVMRNLPPPPVALAMVMRHLPPPPPPPMAIAMVMRHLPPPPPPPPVRMVVRKVMAKAMKHL